MSEQREFETILAAIGERELSDWERQRLWQLIDEQPARLETYLDAQEMASALSEVGLSLATDENVPMAIPSNRPRLAIWLLVAAAAAIAVFMLPRLQHDPAPAMPNHPIQVASRPDPVETTSDPQQAKYEEAIAALPEMGSQKRPPTPFSNAAQAESSILFNEDIRPILSENCFACHGPDAKHREADLRLDTREGALADGAIVPGKPHESEVMARIMTDDPDDIMPPPDSHKTLTPKQIQIIKKWIEAGATWQEHWSYVKPTQTKQPTIAKKASPSWGRNEIDHFVGSRLADAGLKPNQPANRYALARRVALDLTGLPPTATAVRAFVTDSRPDAYERFVDELLRSPHYGEHRSRFWLDAARYGDTHGMHLDNFREIWPYRDWLIKAFNDNMPFDQFAIEQLAGDLLPEPTEAQRIATGFGRCNVTTAEGGSIPEEVDVRYMVDRTETTATVFLGMTAGCAACHDHKFDPLSQKEFYQLAAFFNNTTQPAMDGNQKDSPPVLVIPKEERRKEWQSLLAKRKDMRSAIAPDEDLLAPTKDWWTNRPQESLTPVDQDKLVIAASLADRRAMLNGEMVDLEGPKTVRPDPDHPSGKPAGHRFTGKESWHLPNGPALKSDRPYAISMWVRSPDDVRGLQLLRFGKNVETKGKKQFVGLEVRASVQGGVNLTFRENGRFLGPRVAGEDGLAPRKWQHLLIRYNGGGSNSSFLFSIDGRQRTTRLGVVQTLQDKPAEPISGKFFIGQQMDLAGLSHFRVYDRWLNDEEVGLLAKEFELNELLKSKRSWDELKDEERDLLIRWYRQNLHEPSRQANAALAETQPRHGYIYARSTTTLVMEEDKSQDPVAWVLERGEYDQRREQVTPEVPAALPPMDPSLPKNRLGLAKWLVDKRNPLTARVTVNRLWQSIFGTGLVKTSEDFGSMGARPSHPQLLDWLAAEFVASDWNVKHVIRLMVTSEAYRQSSAATSVALETDPNNRLLSRGPRPRLDAEVLRDQALAVSGLLRSDIGGPSVKPYQPPGLWRVVAFAGSNTNQFRPDKGDKLYRRSLYTFWKRTSPPPSMAAFDAPTRENCTVRRERTNTPLQALVLMNDPQFVEAARYLSQRAMAVANADRYRVRWLFEEAMGRPPTEEDLTDLLTALETFRKHFADSAETAKKLVNTGEAAVPKDIDHRELAALTMIANVVMNRDDFICK